MQQATNLEKLRMWMHEQNIPALLIPREDMFGGEYVASCDERLAWISGFTGSAGLAIVTSDQAHLFVDGRYTLQAKSQAPSFIIYGLNQLEIRKICEGLDSLHYDPWLMSVQKQQEWQHYTNLIALETNPIDLLWTDRPKPIHKSAYSYPITYAGIDHKDKLHLLRKDNFSWFLSDPESVCWLLNIRGSDLPHLPLLQCMALVTKNTITLFCEASKISTELATELGLKVISFEGMISELKFLNTKIAADKRTTPAALHEIHFHWQTDPCELQKAKKNPTEQQGMRNCHMRDGVAIIRFWMWLEQQKNITEIDAQDYLETCRSKMDLHKGASFATISGFGPHGAIVHYRAEHKTNTEIKEGIYLVDSGGQYLDGTTDITRTFCIGRPTQEQKINYTLVLKGHISLANISFPVGTSGAQLDGLARQYLWNHGLDYAHGTGHGVGSYLNVHEGPQGISKVRNIALEPGMVVSNEPGLYIEGQYGIRIENLQVVKHSVHKNFYDFESLTLVPYEAKLIEKSMLTQEETDWIIEYYQTIWTNLSPLLNTDEQEWLKGKLTIT